MTEPPDALLLLRFRSGDPIALGMLFGRYELALTAFLLRLLRDRHLAEDVLQDTFLRAVQHLDTIDPDHLRGWLFRVAHRQALLVRRQRKGRSPDALEPVEEVPSRGVGPLEMAEHRDDSARARELLERLPPPQREVIRQRIYEGKRFREIAADLDCPLNTALARMHQDLRRMRLWWGEGGT